MGTILYHGSEYLIENPQFGKGSLHNDYGRGFYCTENIELAKEWACGKQTNGYANIYELDMSDLKCLNLNSKNTISSTGLRFSQTTEPIGKTEALPRRPKIY